VASKNVIDILIKATNQTKQGLTEPIKDLDTLQKAAGKIGPAFTAASAAAAVALGIMLKRSIDAADAVKQMSDRSGASAEFLSAMGHAAEQSDTSLESLGRGAKELNELLAAANSGVPEAAEQFKAYGIEIKNADGSLKSMEQILPEVSDLVAGAGSAAEKSAIAAQFFGKKVGPELVPLLQSGSRGLADMTTEAKALGLVISDETATAAAQFNDDLDKLSGAQRGFANIANGELAPALSAVSGYFVQVVKDSDAWKVAAQALGSALSVLIKAVATLGAAAVQTFSTIGKGLAGIGSAIASAASGDFGGAKTALNAMTAEIAAGWRDIGKIWSAEIPKEAEAGAERVKVANIKAMRDVAAERKKLEEEEARQRKAAQDHLQGLIDKHNELTLTRVQNLEIELQAELEKINTLRLSEDEREKAKALTLENFAIRKKQIEDEEAAEAQRLHEEEISRIQREIEADMRGKEQLRVQQQRDHQTRIDQTNEVINQGNSMTSGLAAGMRTFTDKSIAGNKKIERSFENMFETWKDSFIGAVINSAATQAVAALASSIAAMWAPAATGSAVATGGTSAITGSAALATAVAGTQSAMVAAVQGVAHSGLPRVPREGTYLLAEDEAVLKKQDADQWRAGGFSGDQTIIVNLDGEPILKAVQKGSRNGRLTIDARSVKS
jgi:hypothetical protein